MCSTDGPESLKDWREPAGLGFVVKIKDGYGSKGVYLMESGFGGREQISGESMTREMVMEKMQKVENRNQRVGNLHAEELVKSSTIGIPTPFTWRMGRSCMSLLYTTEVPILNVLPSLMNASIALTSTDVSAGFGSINRLNQVSAASRQKMHLSLITRDVGILLDLKNGINSWLWPRK
jgi:hypothetical protein